MENRTNRTESYVCSLDPLSCVDMEILEAIRKSVSVYNKSIQWEPSDYRDTVRKTKRVTVKGREPIEKETYFSRWTNTFRTRGYSFHGDIVGNKYTNSKRLDIYIHDDFRWKDA